MKRIISTIAIVLFMGLILVSCQSDKVSPTGNSGNPSLAGAAGDPHPALDTVCQRSDTLYLHNEATGSRTVDKCFAPFTGALVTCPTGQMPWGYAMAAEGYFDGQNVVDFEFTLATGWFADMESWRVGLPGTIELSINGIPVVNTYDWGMNIINPTQNKWTLRIPVANFPTPSFDVSLRITVVKLGAFSGAVVPGSQTTLWAQNDNYNSTNPVWEDALSNSQWVLQFRPFRCMDTPPVPTDSTIHGGTCAKCEASSFVYFTTTNSNCVAVNSCKDLSNVVLRDCNGVDYKYDGLSGNTGTFCHPSGNPIATVWVKSGCYQSGDGPGYGRRFENPLSPCN